MKTYQAKKEEIQRQWYLVNAEGKVLGRLATDLAKILRGKKKPIYTPHVDTGDFVVVVNANKTIAFDLGISPRTVEIYRANLMTKMAANSLSDLVRMAMLSGILDNAGKGAR